MGEALLLALVPPFNLRVCIPDRTVGDALILGDETDDDDASWLLLSAAVSFVVLTMEGGVGALSSIMAVSTLSSLGDSFVLAAEDDLLVDWQCICIHIR